ncbi:hypothetical protein Hanom_Chr07g00608761 [Helianthus anomalus]
MDGVNKSDENGKISNLLDHMRINKALDESRKTGQTSGTKMAFYSLINVHFATSMFFYKTCNCIRHRTKCRR